MAATKDRLSRTGDKLSAVWLTKTNLDVIAKELGLSELTTKMIRAELPGREGERWFLLVDNDESPRFWITMNNTEFKRRYEFVDGLYTPRKLSWVKAKTR